MKFWKLHGFGNDFVLIDARKRLVRFSKARIHAIGDRTRGVGFDQLLLLTRSKRADVRLHIYNTDGSRAEMCGNGLRATALWLWDVAGLGDETAEIEADPGVSWCIRLKNGRIACSMGTPKSRAVGAMTGVNVGNPHLVTFKWPKSSEEFRRLGAKLEYHRAFPRRTNVEFARKLGVNRFEVRVWERGVGETKACGSGAVAVVMAAIQKKLTKKDADGTVRASVKFPGGTARVMIRENGEAILEGTAEISFCGEL